MDRPAEPIEKAAEPAAALPAPAAGRPPRSRGRMPRSAAPQGHREGTGQELPGGSLPARGRAGGSPSPTVLPVSEARVAYARYRTGCADRYTVGDGEPPAALRARSVNLLVTRSCVPTGTEAAEPTGAATARSRRPGGRRVPTAARSAPGLDVPRRGLHARPGVEAPGAAQPCGCGSWWPRKHANAGRKRLRVRPAPHPGTHNPATRSLSGDGRAARGRPDPAAPARRARARR